MVVVRVAISLISTSEVRKAALLIVWFRPREHAGVASNADDAIAGDARRPRRWQASSRLSPWM